MQIEVGFEIAYRCPQPTPMLLVLNIHHSRAPDLAQPDLLQTDPPVPLSHYRDGFGNWCARIVAPAGTIALSTRAVVRDSGLPDPVVPDAQQVPIEHLPEDSLVYLLGSRYCDTDALYDVAWQHFGHVTGGWTRVQAICDFVHRHIAFGYHDASRTRTASDAWRDRVGVCRDYAHLAIALCRCLNIPARYCTGYLGDIGMPPPYGPMDFAAWFEVWLGDRWHTFDARNNQPRIGRVLMARGRDACDVALTTAFGPSVLERFVVRCDEIVET